MDFYKLVKNRRSIRAFKEKGIPREVIIRLLEAARWAPSAGNTQPWHFFVVEKEKIRNRLSKEVYGRDWMLKAPVVIVVCALFKLSNARHGDRGLKLYCFQDTAAAIQNILLSAKSEGLGACWVGSFDEGACSEVLDIPRDMRPIAMIPLGYPDERDVQSSRKPLEDIVDYI